MDPTGYDVLNAVALKKMATASMIAGTLGADVGTVEATLGMLADQGLVVVAGGAALPTDTAEPALKAAAAERFAAVRTDPAVLAHVDRFEAVNAQFLTTISAWQQIDVGGRKV